MNLRNFTAHDLKLYDDSENVVIIPSEGIAKLMTSNVLNNWVEVTKGDEMVKIPIMEGMHGLSHPLPTKNKDTLIIVSSIVKQYCKEWSGRTDLVSPTSIIKDADGTILGFKALVQ